ncbi:MAG TPA: CPBP family glutamic-type intramembrane protease [Rhizobiaceae bacterium]
MAWLERLYERDPKRFALCQLAFLLGAIFIYLWVLPVWYWAIYLGGITVPRGLSDFLYWIWVNQRVFRTVLIVLLIVFLWVSYYVRRDPFKDLGIRTDNLLASGRECLAVALVFIASAVAVVLSFPQSFSFDEYLARGPYVIFGDMLEGLLSGFMQQFLLQSMFLVCALQIFRRPLTAAFVSALIFSLAHAPNVRLMALTFVFGLLCCLLFLRHRNIIALGITHGVVKEVVRVLFASVIATKTGYYDYNLRVGPPAGRPDYLGHLEYRGDGPLEIPQAGQKRIPISVTNIGSSMWDSDAETGPVFLSYHLLDAAKAKRVFSKVLAPLGKRIGPGESALVDLPVEAPSTPGDYLVEVDLVEQPDANAGWFYHFRSRGLKTIYLPMTSR